MHEETENKEVDVERRKFIIGSTAVVGGIGLAAASVPFLGSFLPSRKAEALGAPVKVDVSKILPNEKITVSWRGQPIFVVHRNKESLESLAKSEALLRDPNSTESIQPAYTSNNYRSIKQPYFVSVALCTHLGCIPLFKPEPGSVDSDWIGGYFCPCHGSKYDAAGRVYKGVPAPTNLTIPPYRFIDDNTIIIGEDENAIGNS